MTRASHPHQRVVAVLMMLLTLAAVALVSAGAAHHHGAAHPHGTAHHGTAAATAIDAPVSAVDSPVSAFDEAAHEHEHGNEWAPVPVKRLRPVAGVTVVCVLPACDELTALPGAVVVPSPDRRVPSASIEVLRV